jgi:deazaflavin-dependent oxidoreductase (nitroreductase family)
VRDLGLPIPPETANAEGHLMARTYRLGPIRRAVNTTMAALLRIGIGDRSTYLLTTTGARSGQSRTTPVVLVETDTALWLVSPYGNVGWVHNVRAHPQISLRRGRTSRPALAREVDPETAGPVLRRYLRQAHVTAPFFDARAEDPAQMFVKEADQHPVFALTLTLT